MGISNPISKAEKRAWDFSKADFSEWNRVTENPGLNSEVIRLRESYGLPLDCVHISQCGDWLGWDEPLGFDLAGEIVTIGEKSRRREQLFTEVRELMARFDIPDKFNISIQNWVILGRRVLGYANLGFPTEQGYQSKDGKWIHELIITPETDLGNPLVIEYINYWQSHFAQKPPQPKPLASHPRKLDWRPVWEWRNRHPQVTDREIAEMLNRNRVAVSRALERLDKENVLQKDDIL